MLTKLGIDYWEQSCPSKINYWNAHHQQTHSRREKSHKAPWFSLPNWITLLNDVSGGGESRMGSLLALFQMWRGALDEKTLPLSSRKDTTRTTACNCCLWEPRLPGKSQRLASYYRQNSICQQCSPSLLSDRSHSNNVSPLRITLSNVNHWSHNRLC